MKRGEGGRIGGKLRLSTGGEEKKRGRSFAFAGARRIPVAVGEKGGGGEKEEKKNMGRKRFPNLILGFE